MRNILRTTAILCVLSSSAFAADLGTLPMKARPYEPPAPVNSWDGLYLGVDGGFAQGTFSLNVTPGTGVSGSNNAWFGGVHAGYQRQFERFIIGLESDFDLSTLKTTIGTGAGAPVATLPWFGTARVRAGFLVTPNLLLYGTGGAAYGDTQVTVGAATIQLPGVGWAAGGGGEFLLGSSWMIRAEYLRMSLNSISATFPGASFSTNTSTNLVRTGLSYKF